MAKEVMKRKASDNVYLHRDFHGGLSRWDMNTSSIPQIPETPPALSWSNEESRAQPKGLDK